MVINLKKLFLHILIMFTLFILNGCNIDWLGLIYSSDLDERLLEQNNFQFIKTNEYDWTTITLPDSYSFIVLADTHIENTNAWGFENLISVISENQKIEFVVVLGDITQYGALQDINRFIEIAGTMGVPCYPVIGNHDIYFGNWPVYRESIGSTRYRIDGINVQGDTKAAFFILDSANSFFGKQQMDWLERELKNANGHIFVFTHSPLFITGPLEIHQNSDYRERSRLISILQGKCDIMFMGHSHNRAENKTGGVQYVSIEDFKSTKTYCIVTVDASGVTYKFEKL